MQHEAFGRDLNDFACFGAGQGGFEHRFVVLGIKAVTNLRGNHGDPVFAKHIAQLAHGQFDSFKQRTGNFALLFVAASSARFMLS